MILADTSVWIDHLRRGNTTLAALLEEDRIVTHEDVLGELAAGFLSPREPTLRRLHTLQRVSRVSHDEALVFLSRHALAGKGLGWTDVHLLAACVIANVRIWTLDRRLGRVAAALHLSASI